MKVGGIVGQMVFLMVDTNNYDLLLGLDFLMKIGIIIDIKKGIIKIRNRPRYGGKNITSECGEHVASVGVV
jgi:hypothetical protein